MPNCIAFPFFFPFSPVSVVNCTFLPIPVVGAKVMLFLVRLVVPLAEAALKPDSNGSLHVSFGGDSQ